MRHLTLLALAACSQGIPDDSDSGTDITPDTDVDTTSDTEADTEPDTDAGPRPVAELLETWFDGYNDGLGTDYLTAPYEVFPEGDARYPDTAHTFYADVPYGPHPRNVMDVWSVDSETPSGIAVFIHGGGFVGGGKDAIHDSPSVGRLLNAGVSVAAINYRWAFRDPELAVLATDPDAAGTEHDVNGARLDFVLRDCARAIQFVRYMADDFNVDTSRIGAWGGSAGAGCTVWTGTIDDLADPDHTDPVLRESSRLAVMAHQNGQPTYNWLVWPDLMDMDPTEVFAATEGEATRLLQMSLDDQRDTVMGQELSALLDYHSNLGPGDPPLLTVNPRPDVAADEATDSEIIHHPRAALALYERCVDQGLTCETHTSMQTTSYPGGLIGFLVDHVGPDAGL